MLAVGIIGYGTIGRVVARALDDGISGMRLAAVATGRRDKAAAAMTELSQPVEIMSIAAVAERCDIVVDCTKSGVRDIAETTLGLGRILVTVSGAGILANPDIEEFGRDNGGRVMLATGGLLGLDAVRAAAEGQINEVRMITRKPPNALKDAPHIIDNDINLDGLNGAVKVFEGSAREGAMAFPANVNVAAALGLAGVGVDATRLEVWADPHLQRNTHAIEVDADSARFTLNIENVQSPENPGTGKIIA